MSNPWEWTLASMNRFSLNLTRCRTPRNGRIDAGLENTKTYLLRSQISKNQSMYFVVGRHSRHSLSPDVQFNWSAPVRSIVKRLTSLNNGEDVYDGKDSVALRGPGPSGGAKIMTGCILH